MERGTDAVIPTFFNMLSLIDGKVEFKDPFVVPSIKLDKLVS